MSDSFYSFSEAKLGRLFPIYLVFDHNLNILSIGGAIVEKMNLHIGGNFLAEFDVLNLKTPVLNFNCIVALCDRPLILIPRSNTTFNISGEFNIDHDRLIFIGTSINQNQKIISKGGNNTPLLSKQAEITELHQTINDQQILIDQLNDSLKLVDARLGEEMVRVNERGDRLSQLIANMQNGVLVEDEHRNIILINEKFCNIFNIPLSPFQLQGVNCADFARQSSSLFKDPEQFLAEIDELLELKVIKLNHILELKDGRILNRDYIPVYLNDAYKGHMWKYSDVTVAKLTERKLEEQKKFYEYILNEIPADIAVFSNQHRYLFVNPLGIKDAHLRQWIIGKTDEDYCRYRNRDMSIAVDRRKLFNEVVSSRKQKEWVEPFKNAEGQMEYHLRKMYPVFNDNNQLELVIGYGINITETKRIEEKIRLSEERYRSIFNYSLALICTHDLDGNILDVNNATIETAGYSREELIGSPLKNLVPPDKRWEFESQYLNVIKTKGKAEGIMMVKSKTGKSLYLLYHNFLMTDDTEMPYVIGFSQNITDRIEADRALKKSEEKYRNIIANMNMGLMEVDVEENIIYANSSFCKMSGFTLGELVGTNAANLFMQYDGNISNEEINRRRKLGESDAYELLVKNKQGETRWWLISGAPTFDTTGKFIGSVGIHLDITLQKNLEIELRKAKQDAEHSAHAKEVFLANISHEIRTPMNAILGIGRLLSKTTLGTQQRFYHNTIQNAANNLLVIINDLLDFSKIEAGKLSLEHIGFELKSIIGNAIQILKHKAEEKGLLLTYDNSPQLAPVLLGDPYRINQVLLNLLSNSLKFTEKGEIRVVCRVLRDESKQQTIQFVVSDTGIGMNKEFLDNLFDKFSQEDESVSRKFGGTGLGMSISKQLIELMGGHISAESEKNKGTIISFSIVFPKGNYNDLPHTKYSVIDTHILKGKRILLVEDNEMNRLLANTVLSQYGAEVIEAEDGQMAIDKFEHNVFDLILMDVQMPIKDGLETTKFIRANIDSSIPIIALTANAFKKEEERCIEAGMNDFISKPFDEDKLVQLVAKWLGRESNSSSPAIAKAHTENALFDLNKLVLISKGDEEFVKKMVSLFINLIPDVLTQMDQAYNNKDWKKMASLAHRIKPSIQSLSIITLEKDIAALENAATSTYSKVEVFDHLKHMEKVLGEIVMQLKVPTIGL